MDIIKYIFKTIWEAFIFWLDLIKQDYFTYWENETMKLRYYKDDYIYYKILGVNTSNGLKYFKSILDKDLIHKTLNDCTIYMMQNVSLHKEIDELYKKYRLSKFEIIVLMNQISDKRSSEPNNMLYFCESAIFKYNKHLKCVNVIFNFRKTIDPLLEYATLYYMGDNVLYYSDKTVIAGDYFSKYTSDVELAKFVLENKQAIVY